MNNKFLKIILAGLFLFAASVSNAAIIEVDYVLTSGSDSYEGNFAGEDTNSNGILENSELTVFINDYYFPSHGDLLDNDWSDFGDYIIATNVWIPNALDADDDNIAYFSWNDQDNSWDTSWVDSASTTLKENNVNDIPEPSSLMILALGLIALASRKTIVKR